MGMGEKVIKDAVHGYVPIPEEYFRRFIDTPHFQRLRRIEQTSMRVLYPSARHDRFIHSVGTFHLGRLALENLIRNSPQVEIAPEDQEAFKIACLLHDCGHAPFSHTFENYFSAKSPLLELLKRYAPNHENFHDDLENSAEAASHEYLSALLAVTVFGDAIQSCGADPLLVARMIVGAEFLTPTPRNALIQLLNGRAIDVDKLDYVLRDIAVSGIRTHQVDVQRLLSSLQVVQLDGFKLCFGKQALSAISNVFEVKNFLQQWVFSHHTVQYDQHLLKQCVKEAAVAHTGAKDPDSALGAIFNPNTYLGRGDLPEPCIKMLCDDDLVHLIKKYEVPTASEWLYRQYKMVPLWKSYSEFCYLFGRAGIHDKKGKIERCLNEIGLAEGTWLLLMQTEKHLVIEHDALNICMSKEVVVPYGQLTHYLTRSWMEQFYYVYMQRNQLHFKDVVIRRLKEAIH